MRKLVEEVQSEGMEKLLGEVITVFCANYIYTGKLIGVNDRCILLLNPSIVYETGPFNQPTWKDAQRLPKDEWYIMLNAIESFGIMK